MTKTVLLQKQNNFSNAHTHNEMIIDDVSLTKGIDIPPSRSLGYQVKDGLCTHFAYRIQK